LLRSFGDLKTTGTAHVLRLALDAVDVGAGNNVPCLHVAIHALGNAGLLRLIAVGDPIGGLVVDTIQIHIQQRSRVSSA